MSQAWQGPKNSCVGAYWRRLHGRFHWVRKHLRRTVMQPSLKASIRQLDFGF